MFRVTYRCTVRLRHPSFERTSLLDARVTIILTKRDIQRKNFDEKGINVQKRTRIRKKITREIYPSIIFVPMKLRLCFTCHAFLFSSMNFVLLRATSTAFSATRLNIIPLATTRFISFSQCTSTTLTH